MGVAVSVVVVACILLSVILMARNMREVKFPLYLHFGVKFEDPVDRVTDPNDMDYDAFVSYQ